MKVGLLTAPYRDRALPQVLEEVSAIGVEAVELGTGNAPGDHHCPLDRLLDNPAEQEALLALIEGNGMTISALSQHGNPLHPKRGIATAAHETWQKTVRLAEQLGVPIVNAFSGCPGDGDTAAYPNWVTCAWPSEYIELLEWQWRERVVPYWQAEERFAASHGVKAAIEMHAGFVVYNPASLLRLRHATGENLGSNFDPSHLFWQAIDPLEAIAVLSAEGAIFHVHAKDTRLNSTAISRNGVLDIRPPTDTDRRAWSFCTLGLGHDKQCWGEIVSALRSAGYDYVLSIEHEDELVETDEAIRQSVRLLKEVVSGQFSGQDSSIESALPDGRAATDGGVKHLLLEGGNR
jgi:sugar phosphate isomerase/epimerase